MGEAERGEAAPRNRIPFWCANLHETRVAFGGARRQGPQEVGQRPDEPCEAVDGIAKSGRELGPAAYAGDRVGTRPLAIIWRYAVYSVRVWLMLQGAPPCCVSVGRSFWFEHQSSGRPARPT